MIHRITKLILPVAGRGERLLPLTEKTPKNLICVNGKPLLEYGLEEAVLSGIKDVILIISPFHRKQFRAYLKKNAKKFPSLRFHIREQETPGGNGHALIKACDLIKNEPFAVRFCDDIILTDKKPVLLSLIEIFQAKKMPVLLLERVKKSLVSRFGVVGVQDSKTTHWKDGGYLYRITKIIEKPSLKNAPSNLTIVAGYVLTPRMLHDLKSVAETLPSIADDALPLAVALQIELIVGGRVLGWEFPGKRLDCGTLERLKKTEEFLKKRRG